MTRFLTLFTSTLLATTTLFAAHLPGGNITYECLGNNQYEVTLQLFRECSGAVMLDQDLNFQSDCGSSFTLTLSPGVGTEVSQLCPADLPQSSCNGGPLPGILVYEITTTVTMAPCSKWTISWASCCRNPSLNISGTPGIYIEAMLDNTVSACNNSPQFSESAAPYVCANQPVSYSMGVTESDGDQLRYAFIDARFTGPNPMPVFYAGTFSGPVPYTGMTLDPITGQINFTPDMAGYVVIAVRVDEIAANGDTIGSVMRDIPFVVLACSNNSPDPTTGSIINLSGMATMVDSMSLMMCPGQSFCFDASIQDPDVGQVVNLTSNVDVVLSGSTMSTSGTNPAIATICWMAPAASTGFFAFTITAEDDACPQTAIQSYAYSVTILAASDSICLTTSISGIDPNSGIMIRPNPAKDQLILSLPASEIDGPIGVRFLDLTGKELHSTTLVMTGHVGQIPIPAHLPNGTYVLSIKGASTLSMTKRVTIMR